MSGTTKCRCRLGVDTKIDIYVATPDMSATCLRQVQLSTSTSPALFHSKGWSNTTHNQPYLPRSVHSRCGRPGEVSLCRANAHLRLLLWLNVNLNITTLFCCSLLQASGLKTTPNPSSQPRLVYT
jgi:hypothetical protein